VNRMHRLDWKVLLWVACVACSNESGLPAMQSSGVMPIAGSTTTIPPAVGAAGMSSATPPAAGKPAQPPTTTAMAGTIAAPPSTVGAAGSAPLAGGAGSSASAAGSSAAAAGSSAIGGAMASAAGSGAAGSGAGGAGSVPSEGGKVKHACLKSPNNMVFVGDSYVNYFVAHTELNVLVAQDAVKDGALKQGQTYPDYAVAGTTIAAAPAQIPGQWTQAKAANKNIQFVVMDGGGNDVLINNMQCKVDGAAKDPTCQQVVMNSLDAGTKMMTDMKASGVTEVVYFFYPHPPTGGWEIDDYTIPMLKDRCASLSDAKFQCRVVDTVPIFQGHDDWYASDGIHANDIGEQAIADAVWKTLKDDCAAQAPSSGCCTAE
jgi:hypothetical protein